MKTPVCDICRLTPIKCVICEKKLDKGELTEADFNVSRAISRSKTDLTLEKAFNLGKCYIGVFRGETGPKLKEYLGRDLIKVESAQDLLNKLDLKVRPSKVFVNGEERQRVALNKAHLNSIGIDSGELKKALVYFKFDASIV
jgi:hypothetical protein